MNIAYTRMNLKFTKREKIALIGLVALLVGYGIYQTAYGYYATNGTITIGRNGTFNIPNMPHGLWGKIRAPPGTVMGPIQITPEP